MKQSSRLLVPLCFAVLVLNFQNCSGGFSTGLDLDSSSTTLVSPATNQPATDPTTSAPSAPPADSLRAYASARGFYVGTSALPEHFSETLYKQTLVSQFNLVTPENAMKWAAIHPDENTYDFSGGDAIADVAAAYGMKIRGHNLAWYNYNPTWLTNGNFSPTELSSILQSHIMNVIGHYKTKYPGQVIAWDVVNEAINDPAGNAVPGLRTTVWSTIGSTPQDYIALAFQTARAADPGALLYYNDYGNDFAGPKATATYNLVSSLKSAGVPIDAVGLQAHLGLGSPISTQAQLMAIMAQYAAIGVKVSLTEFDMSVPLINGIASAASLALQTSAYHDYLAACVASSNCVSFSVWGVADQYSWIPSSFPGFGLPLIFESSYVAKSNVFPTLQEILRSGG